MQAMAAVASGTEVSSRCCLLTEAVNGIGMRMNEARLGSAPLTSGCSLSCKCQDVEKGRYEKSANARHSGDKRAVNASLLGGC